MRIRYRWVSSCSEYDLDAAKRHKSLHKYLWQNHSLHYITHQQRLPMKWLCDFTIEELTVIKWFLISESTEKSQCICEFTPSSLSQQMPWISSMIINHSMSLTKHLCHSYKTICQIKPSRYIFVPLHPSRSLIHSSQWLAPGDSN